MWISGDRFHRLGLDGSRLPHMASKEKSIPYIKTCVINEKHSHLQSHTQNFRPTADGQIPAPVVYNKDIIKYEYDIHNKSSAISNGTAWYSCVQCRIPPCLGS